MEKKLAAALCAAMVLFLIGAPTASAQECPEHSHISATASMCGPNGPEFDCNCVCDRGYHPRTAGQPVSADNPCVRDAPRSPDWGSYQDPLCAYGATRNDRGECSCSAPELGSRRVRMLGMVSLTSARQLAELNLIEDLGRLSRSRVGRLERNPDERSIAIMACYNPLATEGSSGSINAALVDAIDRRTRILCGSADDADDERVEQDCRDTRTLIESIRNLRPGDVTIRFGDRDYSVQEFVDEVLMAKFAELDGRLRALEGWRRDVVDPTLADYGRRIGALERAWRGFLNVTHLRVGGFGRVGFSTAGPATGAGGVSAELLFRFGDLPVGAYGRLEFGGQETAWNVGGSLYLAGGAGLTVFTGGRRDTTIALGFWAEDLLHPFADGPNEVQGSSRGIALGAELSLSIPLPGDAHWVRIRPALAIGHSERYYISAQGAFSVIAGAYVAPSLAIEFQPDW